MQMSFTQGHIRWKQRSQNAVQDGMEKGRCSWKITIRDYRTRKFSHFLNSVFLLKRSIFSFERRPSNKTVLDLILFCGSLVKKSIRKVTSRCLPEHSLTFLCVQWKATIQRIFDHPKKLNDNPIIKWYDFLERYHNLRTICLHLLSSLSSKNEMFLFLCVTLQRQLHLQILQSYPLYFGNALVGLFISILNVHFTSI